MWFIIDDGVLKKCTLLQGETEAVVPEGVKVIGRESFMDCTSLTKVTLPNSVWRIGFMAFRGCTSLVSITLPDNLKVIAEWAFYGCKSLANVTIPKSVRTIGDLAFDRCVSLTSVTIPDSVTVIREHAFSGCTSLAGVTIPGSVTKIRIAAFKDCTSLTSITIPNSVEEIDSAAFCGCTSLTSIIIPNSVTVIGSTAFCRCTSLEKIEIPESVTTIEEQLFKNCKLLTSITLPSSITSIGQEAFYRCTSLESITIPDSVTDIGEHAFEECTSLASIELPSGLKAIGDKAFFICTSLGNIVLPEGLKKIGNWVFHCCPFTSITIPDSVTEIGSSAFESCNSLANITIPNSVTEIGSTAFQYCKSLENITIPNSVKRICWGAFGDCTSLTSITIPDSVTEIGEYAFFECTLLTSITIPDSVTKIGELAFGDCTSLISAVIPENVTDISEYAFYECPSLKKFNIFGCTVENILGNWSVSDLFDVNITENYEKYMLILHLLLYTKQPEAVAYVKKHFMRLAQYSIDKGDKAKPKEYAELGLLKKRETGTLLEYALSTGKKNSEIIKYLFFRKDERYGIDIEEMDKYIELAVGNTEIMELLLEYKAEHFISDQADIAEKLFRYEVNDGEVKIISYRGTDFDVIIPETICGKPVTAIGDMAFSPNKKLIKEEVRGALYRLNSLYIGENIKSIGNYIFNGSYWLNSITIFGKTVKLSKFGTYKGRPIQWIPIHFDLEKRTMLIISTRNIENMKYDEKSTKNLTWETCTLRKWLNEDFYSCFTDEEKEMIAETVVVNDNNPMYGSDCGNDTVDRIFLLSIDEAEKYFPDDASRTENFSRYNLKAWLLRSKGYTPYRSAVVSNNGRINYNGYSTEYDYGVRPALNIKF